jgi:hypothetical protein
VYRPSGVIAVTWRCDQEREVLVVSLAMTVYISKMLNVPRLCLHFIWNAPSPTEPYPEAGIDITQERDLHGRQEGDRITAPICVMNVQIIVSPLSPTDDGQAEDDCQCCGDPCDDADEPYAPRSRKTNCMECEPCWLCHACRFQMGEKGWICFSCVEPWHESFLDSSTLNRLRLVESKWVNDE